MIKRFVAFYYDKYSNNQKTLELGDGVYKQVITVKSPIVQCKQAQLSKLVI